MMEKIPPRMIPWEFVDLIETDPARRVKLKISLDRLAKLHPADIADIVEELAPAEREAIFETLDEEVAAETLEELDPKMQVSVLSSLDSERAADIVEEMDPDAAADVLGDMPPETTEEILTEMEPEERAEVAELMTFEEDTAAGRMTTDYMALQGGGEGGGCDRDAAELRGRDREREHDLHYWRAGEAAGTGSAVEDCAGYAGDSADAAEHGAYADDSSGGG